MNEIDDILQGGSGRVPADKLMAYLEGKLTPEEQREVELWLSEEGPESDAVEGLQNISPQEIQQLATKVNHKLQHDLKKERYRNKRLFTDNKWAWVAVLLILVLCIAGYIVIRLVKQSF